jgi:hypothetical protein
LFAAAGFLAVALLASGLLATPLSAQEPPDSVQVVVDSLAAVDSLAVDSLAADSLVADSIGALDSPGALDQESDTLSADTIFYNVPRPSRSVASGYATGIWEWDRHALMANGANTLAELFQAIPGLITLSGGDYGTPSAMSAFGQGGAGYRIVRDGFELYPAEGGVVDLQHVGLAGIGRVRLDRSMGQMVVEMWSHEYDDGRPFSVVETGTGDLATNMFRGVFADPRALGGSLAVGLERIDTRGRRTGSEETEGGNRTGTWLRYQLHLKDRFGLGLDYRRMGTQTKVADYVPTTNRTDAIVRAGLRVADGVTLNGYAGRSSVRVEVAPGSYDLTGGSRDQYGGTLGLDLGAFWANASYRGFEGRLPSGRIEATGGVTSLRWGGVSGRFARASWNDVNTSNLGARAWVTPVGGLTLFGAYEAGEFGSRDGPLLEGSPAPPIAPNRGIVPGIATITDRTTWRAGLTVSQWGVTLGGAALYAWSDLALPLGTELDVGAPADVGVHRRGYEGMAVLPTILDGLRIEGSYQWWDEEGPYLPEQVYRGSFEFHRVFKESGNLELWGSLGVRGHDSMLTFVADDGTGVGGLARVPFYQSWYVRVQVRVVTVRLWIGMDNMFLRRNLQNYPDRLLPYGRSFFAIRWDLWN